MDFPSYEKSIRDEMDALYSSGVDPWDYRITNRHSYTVDLCQDYWHGGSLMELGCGEGLLLKKLCGMTPKPDIVYGFDISDLAITRAREHIKGSGCGSIINIANIFRKNISWVKTDLVILSDVIPYLVGERGENVDAVSVWLKDLWDKAVTIGGSLVITTWKTTYEFDPRSVLGEAVCSATWRGPADDSGRRPEAGDYCIFTKQDGPMQDALTEEEIDFVKCVCMYPRGKHPRQAGSYSAEGHVPLWEKPEQLGYIRSVGNWKWAPTSKVKLSISVTGGKK